MNTGRRTFCWYISTWSYHYSLGCCESSCVDKQQELSTLPEIGSLLSLAVYWAATIVCSVSICQESEKLAYVGLTSTVLTDCKQFIAQQLSTFRFQTIPWLLHGFILSKREANISRRLIDISKMWIFKGFHIQFQPCPLRSRICLHIYSPMWHLHVPLFTVYRPLPYRISHSGLRYCLSTSCHGKEILCTLDPYVPLSYLSKETVSSANVPRLSHEIFGSPIFKEGEGALKAPVNISYS